MKFPWAVTIKLIVFALCSLFVVTIMWNTLKNATDGEQVTYYAEFYDGSGLRKSDSVRVAGVVVGKVNKIELGDNNRARVEFSVGSSHRLTADTTIHIRYENLIGQRYLSLRPGGGEGEVLAEGTTVPPNQTESALDLSVLMNGFQPLFETLSPEDLNKFAGTIVSVLQGEGGTLNDLLHEIGGISGNLAQHDELIGRLITNLATVVTNLAAKDDQFSSLVVQTHQLVKGLAGDRKVIGASIESMNALAGEMTSLLEEIRPGLRRDLQKAERVLAIYARDRKVFSEILGVTDDFFSRPGRAAQYGSWVELYACKLEVGLVGDLEASLTDLLLGTTHSEVCQ